jgi:hypothetical protein
MRETVRFDADEVQVGVDRVLEQQDLPPEETLAPRLRRLVEEAFATCASLVEPRAVYEEVSPAAFEAVLAPLALSGDDLAVGRVYPRARGLALYVATLGPALSLRVKQLFGENALAEGYMLDAVASGVADMLSYRLAARFAAKLAGRGLDELYVLPYSPGYCGWPTSGQRPLFAALRPEEIGVTLNDSCLMSPIKSVSGVLVAAPGEGHRFRPDFPVCDSCRNRECGRRMASALGRPKGGEARQKQA